MDIKLSEVSVAQRGKTVIRRASLNLASGRLTVIVGPNGAGKSTLLKAIAGILPYEGNILIGDVKISLMSGRQRSRAISYLAQNETIAWPMPVQSVVALGRLPYQTFNHGLTKEDRVAVDRALKRTALSNLSQISVASLSEGEKARVLLARALAVEAKVFLADEPIASLDPKYQLEVMDVLKQEAQANVIVVCVMHDLALAAAYASEVILLNHGEIVAQGSPVHVFNEHNLSSVYGIKPWRQPLKLEPHFRLQGSAV